MNAVKQLFSTCMHAYMYEQTNLQLTVMRSPASGVRITASNKAIQYLFTMHIFQILAYSLGIHLH